MLGNLAVLLVGLAVIAVSLECEEAAGALFVAAFALLGYG